MESIRVTSRRWECSRRILVVNGSFNPSPDYWNDTSWFKLEDAPLPSSWGLVRLLSFREVV
jgi:hypothetical protein